METRRSASLSEGAAAGAPFPAPVPDRSCPRCSQTLGERACKLVCQRCGYYMSCSDY